jgi:hypothetical protein
LLFDLDDDGDLDALDHAAWYENVDGQGNLAPHGFTELAERETTASDLDGDGDLDIITSEPRWYENMDGKGGFRRAQEFPDAESLGPVSRIKIVDAGRDGDMDVVVIAEASSKAALFENVNGLATFRLAETVPVPDGPFGRFVGDVGDVDGDGDLDIATVRPTANAFGHSVYLMRNQGGGSFDEQLVYQDQVLHPFFDPSTHEVGLFDIDTDGALDLVPTTISPDFPIITRRWHRNVDQNGRFSENGVVIIATGMAGLYDLTDVDRDGDLDGLSQVPGQDGIFWTRNDGLGVFTQEPELPWLGLLPFGIADAGDINRDGSIDFISDTIPGAFPRWIDGRTGTIHENVLPPPRLQPGDANRDFWFDQHDLILVAKGGKFETGQPANWEQGDWNGAPGGSVAAPPPGDGVCNRADLERARASGLYRTGPYAMGEPGPRWQIQPVVQKIPGAEVVVHYDASTGSLRMSTLGVGVTSINLFSVERRFQGPRPASLTGEFDVFDAQDIFHFDLNGFHEIDFGPVLAPHLPWKELVRQSFVDGSRLGGGGLGDVRFTCTGCEVDIEALHAAIRSGNAASHFDLDGNSVIDEGDLRVLVHDILRTYLGDSTLDGRFDSADLVHTFQTGEYEDGRRSNSSWSDGDWNVDGEFDSADLLAAFQDGGYEGGKGPEFSARQTIAPLAANMGVDSLATGDIDGDGDLDIIVAINDSQNLNFGTIWWFENVDSRGSFGPGRRVTTLGGRPSSLRVGDVDGDADADLLISSIDNDRIAWFENTNGKGDFGPQRIISTAADFALDANFGDLDGDGDLDVMSASLFDKTIAWYQNVDGRGTFGNTRTIMVANPMAYTAAVQSADVDGDGDQDVLSAHDRYLAWNENLDGRGSFARARIIANTAFGLLAVNTADIDKDGDLDVLSISTTTNSVFWIENQDGKGNFGPLNTISTQANDPRTVEAADFDNDGDLDVISASFDGPLAWYENTNGLGVFGSAQVIDIDARSGSVAIGDIDGDGDIDAACQAFAITDVSFDRMIVWYENE